MPRLLPLLDGHVIEDEYIDTVTAKLDYSLSDKLLAINTGNKPLSKAMLKLYVNQYLHGRWGVTHENIVIGHDYVTHEDILLSGQHRAHMIRIVNDMAAKDEDFFDKYPQCPKDLSIPVQITFGVDVVYADNIDRGKTRTNADVLFRERGVNPLIGEGWNDTPAKRKRWTATFAGAARLVWLRAGGATVSSALKFTPSEMMDFIFQQGHCKLADFVTEVLNIVTNDDGMKGIRMSTPYVAALTYVGSLDVHGNVIEDRKIKILDLLDSVALRLDSPKGSCQNALSKFWDNLTEIPGSKNRDIDWVGPFVKCLNYLLDGAEDVTPQMLKLSKKEAMEYSKFPLLLPGWDELKFEEACAKKATL
jgi:hypothetical protein